MTIDETITKIEQVDELFPMPEYVIWYLKFPKRNYALIACLFFGIGLLTTILEMDSIYRAIPTFIFVTMIALIACLHVPAWYLKRSTEKKRDKYLSE